MTMNREEKPDKDIEESANRISEENQQKNTPLKDEIPWDADDTDPGESRTNRGPTFFI